MTHKVSQSEQDQLDAVLSTDPILVSSMQAEEKRRKRTLKFRIFAAALVVCAVVAGLNFSQVGFASPAENIAAEGWKLWKQRKLVEAEEKFLEAVELEPKSVSAWNGLGWARVNQGKNDDALSAFKKCLELQVNMPAALNGAGQALLAQGKLAEAKEYLQKAAPNANAAWYGLARIALLEEDYNEAQKWSQKIYNLDPANKIAERMLEAAEKKSVPDNLKSLISPPKENSQLSMQAWQHFNRGNMTKAKELFEKSLEQNTNDYSAKNGLAFCLLNMGEVAKAKPLFEECVEHDENAFGAMNGLARCLKAEGKTVDAVKLWKEMEESVGNISAATSGLAYTYLEQGDFEAAKEYFEKLVAAMPDNAEYKSRLKAAEAGLQKAE